MRGVGSDRFRSSALVRDGSIDELERGGALPVAWLESARGRRLGVGARPWRVRRLGRNRRAWRTSRTGSKKRSNWREISRNIKTLRTFRFVHLFSGAEDVLGNGDGGQRRNPGGNIQPGCQGRRRRRPLEGPPFSGVERGGLRRGARGLSMQHLQQGTLEHGSSRSATTEVAAAHLYGLPSNSVEEQQMADVGTLLATRSVEIIGAILKSQRKRKVPPTGTLENPPGTETREEGPAWELPELKAFMEAFEGQVAD